MSLYQVRQLPAPAGSASEPSVAFLGDTNTGLYSPGADQLAISTGGSQRAAIDSSGRLLVGTSTARTLFSNYVPALQVETTGVPSPSASFIHNSNDGVGATLFLGKSRGGGAGSNTAIANGDDLGVIAFNGADGTDIQSVGATIKGIVDGPPGADDLPTRLVFSTTADGAATPTEAMRINNQRELLIGTTTRTANGGVLQISNGITFPGTQSACSDPNTLDDYEEGTFTPTVAGSTGAGTATYTTAVGAYTKIGRLVYVDIALIWSAGTGTGNLQLSGLPFTSASATCALAISRFSTLAVTASNYVAAWVYPGATVIILSMLPVGGGSNADLPYDSAASIWLSGFYFV